MAASDSNVTGEYPAAGDLRQMIAQKPIPQLAEDILKHESTGPGYAIDQARLVVSQLATSLTSGDAETLANCFFTTQAYWKDNLALTSHLRTFESSKVVAKSLVQTSTLRGGIDSLELVESSVVLIPATPTLHFIDCDIAFRTKTPAASCSGRVVLLPQRDVDNKVHWRIWVLFTRLEALDIQKEDEKLLQSPRADFEGKQSIDVDVLIIGAGNAAAALAARLKALNIGSLMLERNASVGDNWALRYDCLQFHVPTSFCEMPFMNYDSSLGAPHLLSRDELAENLRKFVKKFNLNVVTSANVTQTTYNVSSKKWTVEFSTPSGERTATCRQLVQATGVGSQRPYVPAINDTDVYEGLNIHSAAYKNPGVLRSQGVKTVAIIGSANTAFDIAGDCVKAGLHTTMVARTPTYIVPVEHIVDHRSLGSYDLGVAASDRMYLTLPIVVDAALGRGLFAMMASQEPDRYAATRAAGLPVLDSTDPRCALMHNLIERGGGHYVDIGGTKLIDEGKLKVKAGAEPAAFTKRGLVFSDGSKLEADAVIWCTGFRDKNVREVAADVLGSIEANHQDANDVLGAKEIASRMDATWGLDAEGEVRGLWKRQLHLDDFWIMGGYTQQHRWHSKTLALQIQAKLSGILPPAYRDTPVV